MNEIEILKLENRKVRERCQLLLTIENKYEASQSELNTITTELEILESRLAATIVDRETIQNHLENIEKDKTLLETDNNDLKATLNERNQQIFQLQVHNQDLKEELSTFSNSYKDTHSNLTKFEEKNVLLTAENAALQEALIKAKIEIKSKSSEAQSLEDQLAQMPKLLEDLKKADQLLQKQKSQIKVLEEELEVKNSNLLITTLEQNKDLREKNRDYQEKTIKLFQENETFEKTNEALKSKVEDLSKTLTETLRVNVDLKNRLEAITEALEKAQKNNQILDSECRLKDEENFELKNKIEDLELNLGNTKGDKEKLDELYRKLMERYLSVVEEKKESDCLLETLSKGDLEQQTDVELVFKSAIEQLKWASKNLIKEHRGTKQQLQDHFLRVDLDENL